MTEREKLIELLENVQLPRKAKNPYASLADYLLSNGVRLPVRCGECKNHYIRGGWHCWSGNKSLGLYFPAWEWRGVTDTNVGSKKEEEE